MEICKIIDLTIDGDSEDGQGIVCISWYCVFLFKNILFNSWVVCELIYVY
jgi:hypothetical protein